MRSFNYAIAENKQGLAAALEKGYKIKAGGIDLLDMMKERIDKSDRIVSIAQLKDLRGIRERDGGVAIGALTTLRELTENEMLRRKFPALADSIDNAATPQVREVATIGGNILQRPRCWYFRRAEYDCLRKGGQTCFAVNGDNTYHSIYPMGSCHITHPSNIAPAFVAVGAQFVASDGRTSKTYEARDFFVRPSEDVMREHKLPQNEFVTEIFLPKLPDKSAYVEVKEKQSFDWPLAACVATYADKKWNVVLAHVAPIPVRAVAAESLLGDRADIDEALAQQASEAAVADAQPMTQNGFRVHIAKAVVRRALLKACGKDFTA
ncbi:MAG TPA: FAD binding domain-containing protein [Candidatus Sumerlaeota bacterium]|nr:FAD binding domain-containing protein [Candidatus Sumerlaeota bacterium]